MDGLEYMKRESKLVKNTAIIGIGMMCTKGISFLLLPLYTSILSTDEYGIVDLIATLVTLIAYTLTIQFEQGIFRFLVDCRDSEYDKKRYITTTISTVGVSLISGLLLTSIICSLCKVPYLGYLLLNIISTVLASISCQIVRGLGRIEHYTISSFLVASTSIILNVVFICGLNWRVEGMLVATVLGQVIASIYAIASCKIFKYFEIKCFDRDAQRDLLKYSLPMVPNTLCWWVVNVSDRVLITYFLGSSVNGIYAVANKFPALFTTVTNVYQLAWTENAAESAKEKNRDQYYSYVMDQSVTFLICCCAGIILVISLLFPFFINSKFSASYYHILILLIAGLFHTWGNLYGSLFGALMYTTYIAKTTIYAAIVNFAINICLIKVYGLYASSLSTLIAYVIITILRHKEIAQKSRIRYTTAKLIESMALLATAITAYFINKTIITVGSIVIVGIGSFLLNKKMFLLVCNKIVSFVKKRK